MNLSLTGLSIHRSCGYHLKVDHFEPDTSKIIVLLGPNGAGKSTFLRALVGLEAHQAKIEVDGTLLCQLSQQERARLITWQPTDLVNTPGLTCLDWILMGRFPWSKGKWSHADFKTARYCLKRVGLQNENHPISSLSSGQKRRLMIAQGLATEAKFLLFDEPFSHLDLAGTSQIAQVFSRINLENRTLILSMHRLDIAQQLNCYVMVLKDGRVVGQGDFCSVINEESIKDWFNIETKMMNHKGYQYLQHYWLGQGDM